MTNEELCGRIRDGDSEALNALWEQMHSLFHAMALGLHKRHAKLAVSCGVERDDCRQICWFAFLDTVKAFNRKQEPGANFAAYARFHIKRHIFTLLGLRTSKRNPLNLADSIDASVITDDGRFTIADTLVDPDAEAPFREAESADVAREVLECLSALTDERRDIVRRHFWDGMTLSDIAEADGVKKRRVQHVYSDALKKLRRNERLRQIHREFYSNNSFTKHTGLQSFKDNRASSVEWYLEKLEGWLEDAGGEQYAPPAHSAQPQQIIAGAGDNFSPPR